MHKYFQFLFITIFLCMNFLLFYTYCEAKKYELCICAIFQNEAPYLKEWIDYHKKVGVNHFYLYNNNSIDDYKEILRPYVEEGYVELIEWPSKQQENDWEHFSFSIQTNAYTDAIHRSTNKTKWLAIIDIDEFIIPMKDKTIFEALENNFKNASGVCVNWQCYGTSNIFLKSNESILKYLLYKLPKDHPKNLYFKSIIQPIHVIRCSNPHLCDYKRGHWHLNTNHEVIESQNTGVYIDILRINHYWTRDESFLQNIKVPRYEKWGISAEETLKSAEEMNQIYDPILLNKQI